MSALLALPIANRALGRALMPIEKNVVFSKNIHKQNSGVRKAAATELRDLSVSTVEAPASGPFEEMNSHGFAFARAA